jgi:hypothetical protein
MVGVYAFGVWGGGKTDAAGTYDAGALESSLGRISYAQEQLGGAGVANESF